MNTKITRDGQGELAAIIDAGFSGSSYILIEQIAEEYPSVFEDYAREGNIE